ncbi:MAG: RluA family pseudouridine synthase [Thermodesulfobacteriota bacterium]|nr:RluA family pseudouridine synthase [Thermodesulfobacteriota bacterium]
MDNESDRFFFRVISADDQEVRLDVFLSTRSNALSRSSAQRLIKSGAVRVNGCCSKPGYRLKAGDKVILLNQPTSAQIPEPESVDFGIIHEDPSLIVVNKPAGLVVHPAPGHFAGTLVHGLLQHCGVLSGIGGELRPGIVHRLDKDTSGLMVVAKSDSAHAFLAEQFKSGSVKKQYIAIVHGRVKGNEGQIDPPIARHPVRRKQMSVAFAGGRQALTKWEKLEEFQSGFSLLSVSIKTGRTHQIRVHLSHIGHPVAGDPVYGYGRNWWKRHPLYKKGILPLIDRQMLHARRLGFIHPKHNRLFEFEAPLPGDMEGLMRVLKYPNLHARTNKKLDIGRKLFMLS